ncbi:carbohydrate kinase family protein [Paenibacillus sp. S-38]|uniref:carbohydrate kinase family protein n=1 Tax=Paenibacillus sp. S-38 TaxID=3416710 RepID=UPI003CFAA61C
MERSKRSSVTSRKITVFGTVLLDCKGFAHGVYRPDGRNLGTVRFVHGGVGRNVAENLGRLGVPVSLVTTVNEDGNGRAVTEHLWASGVHTGDIAAVPEKGMGFWLAVLDERGIPAGSISDMPDLAAFERLVGERGEALVSASSHIVLVLDLNESLTKTILKLASRFGKPVFGLPSNFSVIAAHPEVLEGLALFVCNEFEAERLFGCGPLAAMAAEEQIERLRSFAVSRSIGRLVVTLGSGGSVFYDADADEAGAQAVVPVEVVDTSGAGDAFFSGAVLALSAGSPLRDAVAAGTRVAAWTIGHPDNCCAALGELARRDPLLRPLLDL